jgi:curved DNA-binding protein
MKYKDYYEILGVKRDASDDEIKKAYRTLARKYHPDVSTDPKGEEKFKDVSEAYKTLKDPEARAAYDNLGKHRPGEDFRPPPDWGQGFGASEFSYEDIDLSDLFAAFGGGRQRGGAIPIPGQDYEVTAPITIEDAWRGTELELNLSVPEIDAQGRMRRVPHTFKARIPKGVTDGERLRLKGKGGKGMNGGPNGNLYLNIEFKPHPVYRATGHDLYLDLPLSPWEAALGASVDVPTPDRSASRCRRAPTPERSYDWPVADYPSAARQKAICLRSFRSSCPPNPQSARKPYSRIWPMPRSLIRARHLPKEVADENRNHRRPMVERTR